MILPKGEFRRVRHLIVVGVSILLAARLVHAAGEPLPLAGEAGKEKAAKLEHVLARLEARMRRANRESGGADAVIEKIGREPMKLCAWVREQTMFVPYAGALRGQRGVLIDRVGGDLDRSLLLAQLVNLSGFEVRLARTELTEAEAEQRLTLAAGLKLPRISAAEPAAEMIKLLERGTTQGQQLAALLKRENDEPAWDKEQIQAARDHWWIQYMDGRSWIDLDPAAAETGSPRHLGAGKTINFACALPDLSARIPPELFHAVELKVVVERWLDGKLLEETALSWAVKTWDDPAVHVYLLHGSDSAPEVTAAGNDGAKLTAALLKDKVWRPLLMVNGRFRGSKTFDESGVLVEAPVGGALAVGNAVRGQFGALSGVNGTVKEKPNSVLTAEWIDFAIKTPGHPPVVVRREVFDSIGPAARARANQSPLPKPVLDDHARLRRALALNATADNLIASCRYSADYVMQRRAKRLLDGRHELVSALLKADSSANRALFSRCLDPDLLGMMNFGRGFDGKAIAGEGASYLDRPNICRLISQREVTGEGKVHRVIMSDLAANSLASLARSGNERFISGLRRGVMDTLCEGIAVGKIKRAANDPAIHTTADAFERAGASPWISVRDPADAALSVQALPADVRQRILNDLAAGNLIVMPKAAIEGRWAWWRIDPRSGQTVGVMDNGRCADEADYAVTQIPEAGLEHTLSTNSLFPEILPQEVANLAEDIIEFREPANLQEMLDCWDEAWELLRPLVNPG